ncbi:MAG: ester cyclase [Gemmatimonadota bacterium]
MQRNVDLLRRFMAEVWSRGDLSALDTFIAESYTVHSDPGDAWEGQTLTRDGFAQRLQTSRAPFPDLRFEITAMVADGDQVAIGWMMRGTHTAPMGELPATGRAIAVQRMTHYEFHEGRITGHRQVVDRMTVGRQLGLFGGG